MRVEIEGPDWIKEGRLELRLLELNPHAVEALIETLRDVHEEDDDRVRLLLQLWDALTGDP